MKTKIIAQLLLGLGLCSASAIGGTAAFDQGKAAWKARDYPAAARLLLTARAEPGGRTPEVDYMLGTSGCHTAGHEDWGKRYLNWTLKNYSLDAASRRLVEHELELCGSETSPPSAEPASISEAVMAQVPGATGSGKMYMIDDRLVANRPAQQLGKLSPEAMEARRITVGHVEDVRAMVAKVSGLTRIEVCGELVVTTDEPNSGDLAAACQNLNHYVSFLKRRFALKSPGIYTIIYLLKDAAGMDRLARRVHLLDLDERTLGYTIHGDASVVALDPSFGLGTAQHELFHLFARTTFGDIPQWLDEGIASVFEVSVRCGEDYYGVTNWRAGVIDQYQFSNVADLVLSTWYPFDEPTSYEHRPDAISKVEHYARDMATARYLALYLQEQGKLATVFATLRDRDPAMTGDPAQDAQRALVASLGKPLPDVQTSLRDWFYRTGRTLTHAKNQCGNLGPVAAAPTVTTFEANTSEASPAFVPETHANGGRANQLAAPTVVPPTVPSTPQPAGCGCRVTGDNRRTSDVMSAIAMVLLLSVRVVRRARPPKAH